MKWLKGLRFQILKLIFVGIFTLITFELVQSHFSGQTESAIKEVTVVRIPSIKGLELMNEGQTGVTMRLLSAIGKKEESARTAETNLAIKKLAQVREGWALYEPLPQTREEKIEWDILVPLWKKWEADVEHAISLMNSQKFEEAEQYILGSAQTSFDNSEIHLFNVLSINYKISDEQRVLAEKAASDGKVYGLFVGTILMLIFGFIGFGLASKLVRLLTELSQSITQSSGEISSASRVLSSASENVASSSTESAASLQETVASVEELAATVEANSKNAEEGARISSICHDEAKIGSVSVKDLIASMDDLAKSSNEIKNVIDVIDDIAFQTNLLALNAAVEAARAGEQGKGFAVVAEAVRALAQRSSEAAKDISTKISDSVSRIHKGVATAQNTSKSFESIRERVEKVVQLSNDVAIGSKEQSTGLAQINKAMNDLDRSTQLNASASEELAASSNELSAQSNQLEKIILDLMSFISGDDIKKINTFASSQLENNKKSSFKAGLKGDSKIEILDDFFKSP